MQLSRSFVAADLLGADDALADPHVLYECHDRLLARKEASFTHLTGSIASSNPC
jgi:hypothetical protein